MIEAAERGEDASVSHYLSKFNVDPNSADEVRVEPLLPSLLCS
jgi:hypothetical protein